MNNISLVLSGTVSGYVNFFVSQEAKSIQKDDLIDFDIRRFMRLSISEKQYSIAFSPLYIAESLYVGCNDTGNRPGLYVFSLIIPRGKKIVSVSNPNSDTAVYDLLNAVYQRFLEKCFIGEMLNPNLVVLMQDYYSDILDEYTLRDDAGQAKVNMNVDLKQINFKIGYVQAQETDIAAYLANPCRKSYEGYAHVAFGANVSPNITEPPEEERLYTVMVTNTNETRQSVKLNEKIIHVEPGIGEKPINEDYTYQEILDNKAENSIKAEVRDSTILLTYNFPEEELEIKISVKENGREIPFGEIPLRYKTESSTTPISIYSNPWTFKGKEIAEVTVEDANKKYIFSPEKIDLTRLSNGADLCLTAVKREDQVFAPMQNGGMPTTQTGAVPQQGEQNTPGIQTHGTQMSTAFGATTGLRATNNTFNPEPPKKKGLFNRWWFLLTLLLIVIAGIVLIILHPWSKDDAIDNSTEDSETSEIEYFPAKIDINFIVKDKKNKPSDEKPSVEDMSFSVLYIGNKMDNISYEGNHIIVIDSMTLPQIKDIAINLLAGNYTKPEDNKTIEFSWNTQNLTKIEFDSNHIAKIDVDVSVNVSAIANTSSPNGNLTTMKESGFEIFPDKEIIKNALKKSITKKDIKGGENFEKEYKMCNEVLRLYREKCKEQISRFVENDTTKITVTYMWKAISTDKNYQQQMMEWFKRNGYKDYYKD